MEEIKVLLVDDEEEFVNTLSERLGNRKLNTSVVFDGESALKAIKEKSPDVIVLDLKMPGMHGMDVLRKVSKKHPNVKVIILTGHGTDKDEEEARKLGAFDYIQKPADIEHITDRVKEAYRQLKQELENNMSAIAFAEAGEFDFAEDMLKNK